MRFFMDYDNVPNKGPLMLFKDNGDGTSSLATPEDVNIAISEATSHLQKLCEEQKGEIERLKAFGLGGTIQDILKNSERLYSQLAEQNGEIAGRKKQYELVKEIQMSLEKELDTWKEVAAENERQRVKWMKQSEQLESQLAHQNLVLEGYKLMAGLSTTDHLKVQGMIEAQIAEKGREIERMSRELDAWKTASELQIEQVLKATESAKFCESCGWCLPDHDSRCGRYAEVVKELEAQLATQTAEIERLKKERNDLEKLVGGLDVENPSAVDTLIDAMRIQKENYQVTKDLLATQTERIKELEHRVEVCQKFHGQALNEGEL